MDCRRELELTGSCCCLARSIGDRFKTEGLTDLGSLGVTTTRSLQCCHCHRC
jgi:hypothetical protein